ncbi:MAG: nuclear transport factor 2 family protein [Candidatus Marinimicrobia bacterium]|jgi:ketosteroid isomerase-like protein|nr:nuclear transport factor 2 family protein [Candidatus Neomarinimicrobiota bacterium]MBT3631184.1 nuclear transport factor 2 family protein [Candidatus Neomarinimicrobiota bacterium]MBT3824692.1 nuclear transport factor 2 family protein [Candidatus Neomarinimicrobiota bacterium]MBT4131616.1 nuclear transport factor 2 family protein [Candidatus Neomarinimicrobiota bacterium]MBT4296085.1 nuclear transport factor 2 family protein [Candidatus Neomarinimicrobiota bacterium]
MTHSNELLIEQFFKAFSEKDSQAMTNSYHPDAVFDDPVFQNLKGPEIGMMWKMLCLQSRSLEVVAENFQADDSTGQADWSAKYDFGKTHRKVHNKIHAEFKFKDGKIIQHTDHFDFWRWSRMALGPLGFLMGWNSVVKVNIRKQAKANLTKFITKAKNT